MAKRRSFTLNNHPGGMEQEPTGTLIAAALVLPSIIAFFVVALVWSVVTQWPLGIGLTATAVLLFLPEMGGLVLTLTGSLRELRRRCRPTK